jgi:hypothetical protein
MWLKIERHRNHESPRITTNSNPMSDRRGDLLMAARHRELFLTLAASENVSVCASPMCATWTAAHLRKKLSHF